MKQPIKIEVVERLMDYRLVPKIVDGTFVGMVPAPKFHACLAGNEGIWAAGDSPADAIGDLIMAHPKVFNVRVTRLHGKLPR
jgi:hypothetical protein